MSSLWLAALVLGASPDSAAAPPSAGETAAKEAVVEVAELSPKELRDAFRAAIRSSYQAEPKVAVPKLVEVYKRLKRDTQVSNAERTKMQQRVRSRMIAMGDKVVAQARREMDEQRREESASKSDASGDEESDDADAKAPAPNDYQGDGRPGGRGAEDNGEELVELIRTVIAPETWDVNGGPGTIVYYRPLKVLVVRQTRPVHWLIGGFRQALAK